MLKEAKKVMDILAHRLGTEEVTMEDLLFIVKQGIEIEGFKFPHGCFRIAIIYEKANCIIKVPTCEGGLRQCMEEEELYKIACRWGLQSYFARCYGDFIASDIHCFVFKKISNVGNFWWKPSYKSTITRYAEKKGLYAFLCLHRIYDLHPGNFGRLGRVYVITDYSTICPEDWEARVVLSGSYNS